MERGRRSVATERDPWSGADRAQDRWSVAWSVARGWIRPLEAVSNGQPCLPLRSWASRPCCRRVNGRGCRNPAVSARVMRLRQRTVRPPRVRCAHPNQRIACRATQPSRRRARAPDSATRLLRSAMWRLRLAAALPARISRFIAHRAAGTLRTQPKGQLARQRPPQCFLRMNSKRAYCRYAQAAASGPQPLRGFARCHR